MRKALIIGDGNMGNLMQRLLAPAYDVQIINLLNADGNSATRAVNSAEVIVLAIPFKAYQSCIEQIASTINPGVLMVDICSVKEKPEALLRRLLPDHQNWLISHPLFGPQSAANGTKGLDFVVCEQSGELADELIAYCRDQLELNIVEMSARDHDQQMARAQALTFFISETLDNMNVSEQELMTPSYQALLAVRDLVSHESQDLLDLMQLDNSQAVRMREIFIEATNSLNNDYVAKTAQADQN